MVIEAPCLPFPLRHGMDAEDNRSVRVIDVPILKESTISRSLRLLLLDELEEWYSYLAYEPAILSLFDKTILYSCSACLSGNQNWIKIRASDSLN